MRKYHEILYMIIVIYDTFSILKLKIIFFFQICDFILFHFLFNKSLFTFLYYTIYYIKHIFVDRKREGGVKEGSRERCISSLFIHPFVSPVSFSAPRHFPL